MDVLRPCSIDRDYNEHHFLRERIERASYQVLLAHLERSGAELPDIVAPLLDAKPKGGSSKPLRDEFHYRRGEHMSVRTRIYRRIIDLTDGSSVEYEHGRTEGERDHLHDVARNLAYRILDRLDDDAISHIEDEPTGATAISVSHSV